MFIEQAFQSLPEVLVGSRYPSQDYEAGIVAAMGMVLLQELNGRNAPNPLSLLQAERLYKPEGFGNRYLRADLHLNLFPLRSGSRRLARYGWRSSNWLEAKFFRRRQDTPVAKTTNAAMLLADLFRLAACTPLEISRKANLAFSGRYLLHVYDSEPKEYVPFRKNKTRNPATPSFKRQWLSNLYISGRQRLAGFRLREENPSFLSALGEQLKVLELELEVTNFVIHPIPENNADKVFWCYLNRIDAIRLRMEGAGWQVDTARFVEEDATGAHCQLRDFVGQHVSIKDVEGAPPDRGEIEDAQAAEAADHEIANASDVEELNQIDLEAAAEDEIG